MSYTREFEDGKDSVIFLTQEDQQELMAHDNAVLQTDEDEDGPGMGGAIKPNGEIDWDCPCLKGMAYGPCGDEFRGAFSCFVKSEVEPKGLDCVDAFEQMQKCMASNPEHYGPRDEDMEDEDDEANLEGESKEPASDKPAEAAS